MRDQSSGSTVDAPFLRWCLNTIAIAFVAAILTVMLGALAAYAFSRFRFKGRRLGMLLLLLIQMFPQLLLVIAIYLIILNIGAIFPVIGLNTFLAADHRVPRRCHRREHVVDKGFFDTIPAELDESARVDGATPAQIFWGVVLPLAAPVLAVVGLISFIFTINEFVIASAMLQTTQHFTLAVGMRGFIDQQYGQRWGPFAAGTLIAAIPPAVLFLVAAEMDRRRPDAGLRQGMTATELAASASETALAEPHHDGSELYLVERPDELGDDRHRARARPRRRCGRGLAPLRRRRRASDDRGDVDERAGDWWRASFPARNVVTRYRWLLAGGECGLSLVERRAACTRTRSPAATTSCCHSRPRGRRGIWLPPCTRSSPIGSRRAAPRRQPRTGPCRARGMRVPRGVARNTPRELFGGDLTGIEHHLDHIESLGANVIYLTPFFPAGSTHRYDASTFDCVDPLLGGDEAFGLTRARRARSRHPLVGDLTLEPLRQPARVVRSGAGGRPSASVRSSTSTRPRSTATRRGSA